MTAYVSVVIPVFDRFDVLELVLRFLAFQTYPRERFEVIVVDDGSRERIGERLAGRELGYRLRTVIQPNLGRASARNRGVEAGEGELVVFCDADRIPHPDWIATHASDHERDPDSAIIGVPWDCFYGARRLAIATASDVPALERYSRLPAYYQVTAPVFADGAAISRVAWATFLVGNASVSRRAILRAGGFDERLLHWGVEHFELALRLVERCGLAIRRGAAASYHVPHARTVLHYREGLEAAVAALAGTPSEHAIAGVRDFLLGEISLQALEQRCHGTRALAARLPIWYRGLAG